VHVHACVVLYVCMYVCHVFLMEMLESTSLMFKKICSLTWGVCLRHDHHHMHSCTCMSVTMRPHDAFMHMYACNVCAPSCVYVCPHVCEGASQEDLFFDMGRMSASRSSQYDPTMHACICMRVTIRPYDVFMHICAHFLMHTHV
jgi:hypothetical protein